MQEETNDNNPKKLKMAKAKMKKIMKIIADKKLESKTICKIKTFDDNWNFRDFFKWKFYGVGVLVLYFAFNCIDFQSPDCYLGAPQAFKNIFHKPEVDCSMCHGVSGVDRVANITKEEFEELYAYTTKTIIITDVAMDWPAMKEFNFDFFKKLYTQTELGTRISECAFFNYQTEFRSLYEVFTMDTNRSKLEKGTKPWYIGWNTCYDEESKILRQYYTTPYFLPESSEPEMTDWFFMGGPGKGAHMHLDHVRLKSWQTQIKGRKRWTLAPPPECYYACNFFEFVVEPGETVIVDTNRWYHQTEVLEGEISLTIGAEYD